MKGTKVQTLGTVAGCLAIGNWVRALVIFIRMRTAN